MGGDKRTRLEKSSQTSSYQSSLDSTHQILDHRLWLAVCQPFLRILLSHLFAGGQGEVQQMWEPPQGAKCRRGRTAPDENQWKNLQEVNAKRHLWMSNPPMWKWILEGGWGLSLKTEVVCNYIILYVCKYIYREREKKHFYAMVSRRVTAQTIPNLWIYGREIGRAPCLAEFPPDLIPLQVRSKARGVAICRWLGCNMM